jgi:hypothetical protein
MVRPQFHSLSAPDLHLNPQTRPYQFHFEAFYSHQVDLKEDLLVGESLIVQIMLIQFKFYLMETKDKIGKVLLFKKNTYYIMELVQRQQMAQLTHLEQK